MLEKSYKFVIVDAEKIFPCKQNTQCQAKVSLFHARDTDERKKKDKQ